jgi:hypothetical protein
LTQRAGPASAGTTPAKSAGVPSRSTTPPNARSAVPVAISSQDCQHRRDVLMISHEQADTADDHRGRRWPWQLPGPISLAEPSVTIATFPACDPVPLCFCIRLFLLVVFRFRVLPARVAGSALKLRCQGPMLLMARQC